MRVVKRYGHALWLLIQTFWWLIIADIALYCYFGTSIAHVDPSSGDAVTLWPLFVESVIKFVLGASLVLFIRKPDSLSSSFYLKKYFFRYVQFMLFITIFMLWGLILLVYLSGIPLVKSPNVPWIATGALQLIESCMLFYWLDSKFALKDIFRACEKSINFLFYNFPIIIVLLGFTWVLESISKWALLGWDTVFIKTGDLAQTLSDKLPGVQFLVLKYILFLGAFFVLSMLFMLYDKQKRVLYAKSFFS